MVTMRGWARTPWAKGHGRWRVCQDCDSGRDDPDGATAYLLLDLEDNSQFWFVIPIKKDRVLTHRGEGLRSRKRSDRRASEGAALVSMH